MRDQQLQVFERKLKTLEKQASANQNLPENTLQQQNLCRRSLGLAEGLTPNEISTGRYDIIFWRFHLIRNLLDSERLSRFSPGKNQHAAELSSLATQQLIDLERPEYAGMRTLERAPSYTQLGNFFLESGKLQDAEKCTRQAIALFENTFGKETAFFTSDPRTRRHLLALSGIPTEAAQPFTIQQQSQRTKWSAPSWTGAGTNHSNTTGNYGRKCNRKWKR